MAITFDTLAYAKRLRTAGVPEQQAEVQAEEMSKVVAIVNENIVTKEHHDRSLKVNSEHYDRSLKVTSEHHDRSLKELEISFKRDMKELEVSFKRDMKELEVSFKRDMKELEVSFKRDMKELELRLRYDLTVRLGAMMFASAGLTIAVLGWLVKM